MDDKEINKATGSIAGQEFNQAQTLSERPKSIDLNDTNLVMNWCAFVLKDLESIIDKIKHKGQ